MADFRSDRREDLSTDKVNHKDEQRQPLDVSLRKDFKEEFFETPQFVLSLFPSRVPLRRREKWESVPHPQG
jgi:hypothetical protein